MTEVTSVNGKTGAVVLKATDVEAIPASEAGQSNGVATLNSGGKLPEAQLPSSVVTGSGTAKKGSVAVASVEGGNGSPILLEAGPDGSAWVADSSTTVGVTWKKAHIFDVTAAPFHAKGDGVTDDHTAIQAAITAAEAAADETVVYFPPAEPGKTYKTSKNFTIIGANTHINFLGSYGPSRIVLTEDLTFGEHLFQTPETESAGQPIRYYVGMVIQGPPLWPLAPNKKEAQGYFPCYAMGFEVNAWRRFVNCESRGFYAGYDIRATNNYLDNCQAANCFYGVYCGPDPISAGTQQGGPVLRNVRNIASLWAGIGVHPHTTIESQAWLEVFTEHAPYVMYFEGPQGIQYNPVQFLTGIQAPSGEENGNAHFYDECVALPSELHPLGEGKIKGVFESMNISFNGVNAVGNAQVLAVTATGGTYTLTLPATRKFAGGTTAAVSWNATNKEIETAITNLLKAGNGAVVVSTVESTNRQILFEGYACLLEEQKMTVNTEGLTGGSATLTEPAPDPNMGPLIRPTTTQKITVSKATGGTFTIVVKVGAGGEKITKALKWNCSYSEMTAAIIELENVGAYGCVVTPKSGPYILSFTGALLHQTVTVTVNGAGLIGTEPTVVVEAGPTGKLANRHHEYAIDVGKLAIHLLGTSASPAAGADKGFARVKYEIERFDVQDAPADSLINIAQEGKTILSGGNNVINGMARIRSTSGDFTMGYISTAIEEGSLLAISGPTSKVEVYPAAAAKGALAKPHAGIAACSTTGAQFIPILRLARGTVNNSKFLYDGAGVPNALVHLKPSTTTAGQVTTATEASDLIVGATTTKGSAGKVEAIPKGC